MFQLVAGTGLTTEMLVVFVVILVALVVLEPWTGVTPADGVSGFASSATVTVLAMFVLSEGVRRTGVVNIPSRTPRPVTCTRRGCR